MEYCSTKHPDHPGAICTLPRRPHPDHLAIRHLAHTSEPEQLTWPNPDYKSPQAYRAEAQKASATIQRHAATVREEIRRSTPQRSLGTTPGQRKKTRLGQVANLLVNNVGVWIDGYRLETQEIGGSSGLRRIRELRDDYGWDIEHRPVTDSTDQYRLVELPDEFKD